MIDSDLKKLGNVFLIPSWEDLDGWNYTEGNGAEGVVIGTSVYFTKNCLDLLVISGSAAHREGYVGHFSIQEWYKELRFVRRLELTEFLDTLKEHEVPLPVEYSGHELVSMFLDD